MNANVVEIGKCGSCGRMGRVQDGACARCRSEFGPKIGTLLERVRAEPEFAEVVREMVAERLVSKYGEKAASQLVETFRSEGSPLFIEMFGLSKGPR